MGGGGGGLSAMSASAESPSPQPSPRKRGEGERPRLLKRGENKRGGPMFSLAELEHAHELVRQAVPPTPSHVWPLLSERLGATVTVKHENHTPIGAFKVRGGLTYVDRLKRERAKKPGLISATRG